VSHLPQQYDIPFRSELARKLLHLLALVIPIAALLLGRGLALALLVPLTLVAISADIFRARNASFHRFIDRFFGFMMRPVEKPGVGTKVVINGATWVLLAATLLALIFPLEVGMPAFIVFMVADASAALVGRRLGRINWPRTSRTIEGSLAFFATGLLLYMLWGTFGVLMILLIMLVGTLAEALPGPLNDNIRVPLLMAGVTWLLDLLAFTTIS
jgi:dolichol kinase